MIFFVFCVDVYRLGLARLRSHEFLRAADGVVVFFVGGWLNGVEILGACASKHFGLIEFLKNACESQSDAVAGCRLHENAKGKIAQFSVTRCEQTTLSQYAKLILLTGTIYCGH